MSMFRVQGVRVYKGFGLGFRFKTLMFRVLGLGVRFGLGLR